MHKGGAKPGQRFGGRAKGTPNKATLELAERARKYTDKALGVYIETIDATKFELEPTGEHDKLTGEPKVKLVKTYRYSNEMRQRAADALLNRGWGTPTQSHMLQGPGDDGAHQINHNLPDLKDLPVAELAKLFRAAVAPGS